MFDDLQDMIGALSARLDPDERRRIVQGMREALVHARLATRDLESAIVDTRSRLVAEQTELETVRRRMGYATAIGDEETVAVAERFAEQHSEKIAMLETKLMAQRQELAVAEREYDMMSAELRRALSGLTPDRGASAEAAAMRELDDLLSGAGSAGGGESGMMGGSSSSPSSRTRAEREAEADARLAALKRRMGK